MSPVLSERGLCSQLSNFLMVMLGLDLNLVM
jgi:hypothetical protein